MKSVKYVGLALIATTLLGAAPGVFAAEGGTIAADKKSGTTNVEVNFEDITDPDDTKARLDLVTVPTSYTFTTQFTGDSTYEITAATTEPATAEYNVFDNVKNDSRNWYVSSRIAGNELKSGGTIVSVDSLTLNGKNLIGGTLFQKADATVDDTTGVNYKLNVSDLKIKISEKTGKIKSTDKLVGDLVTTLSNVAPAD